MGKSLIILGADFSANAVVEKVQLSIQQGSVNLVKSSVKYGDYLPASDGNYEKRLRVINTNLIYIEQGTIINFSGLKGNTGQETALRIDAGIYSSANNPSKSTIITTLNGETTNYYPYNEGGGDTCMITAPTTGYYAFCFVSQDLTQNISYIPYASSVEIRLS